MITRALGQLPTQKIKGKQSLHHLPDAANLMRDQIIVFVTQVVVVHDLSLDHKPIL